jgi:hypothetical protein
MGQDDPYFAQDTDGVHFQVCVDGADVWAYVERDALARRYSAPMNTLDWVAVYRAHREEIDACVARRVRLAGAEIIILRLRDL